MPIFTGTPVDVSPSPYLWSYTYGGNKGPFHSGGNLYIAGFNGTTDLSNTNGVAKSTDGGGTWSVVRDGVYGSPATSFMGVVLDEANNKLVIAGQRGATEYELRTYSYDLGTDTFSTITALSLSGGIITGNRLEVVIRDNGEVGVVYGVTSSGGSG